MAAACCTAFRWEMCKGSMFDTVEQPRSSAVLDHHDQSHVVSGANDDEARRIDILETFSPQPRVLYIGCKIGLTGWIASVMAQSIMRVQYPSFWLAYLTHWGLVIATAYILMSTMSAVYLASCSSHSKCDELNSGAKVLINLTWGLLAAAAPMEITITILYWVLEFEGTFSYVSMMTHGGVMILVMIDGFVLSRVPLRIKQFVFFELFALVYCVWTIIHAYSGMGNPYAEGDEPTESDDAIYDSIAWKNNMKPTAILIVVLLLVANPIIFLFCRLLSRILPQRFRKKVARALTTSNV